VNLSVGGATTFTGSRDDHIDVRTLATHTGSARLSVANATFLSPASAGYTNSGGGIRVSPVGNGSTEVRVSGSTITGTRGPAITVSTDGVTSAAGPAPNVEAEITSNIIGSAGTPNSGSVNDRAVVLEAWNRALLQASVTNNVLRQYNFGGIYGLVRGAAGTAPALDLNLSGNNLANPASNGTYGVRLEVGNTSGDTGTMCLNAGANAITGSGLVAQDLWLTKTGTAALRLPGLGTLTAAGAQALLQAQIGGGADVLVSDSGSGSYASGSCQQPSIP
jgi:hypothetical protein